MQVWESAQLHMRTACELAGLDSSVIELMVNPMRVTEFQIPVRMDNGEAKVFTAFRVCHNNALGQTKDGVRVRPDLTVDELKALAMFMSIKHAINDIPAGGGKGGIKADPRKLSEWEYERLIRGFIRRMEPKGAWTDIPGADIGTSLQTQAWMLDEYEQIKGFHSPAAVNDKPPIIGGSLGGDEATGRGIYHITKQVSKDKSLDPQSTRIVIQGFGQVGSHAAKLLYEDGFKIIAVADVFGGVFNDKGLDIPKLTDHVNNTGSVKEFADSDSLKNEELFKVDCEIIIPAAVQDVINTKNVGDIRAKIIVEAANGPITPEADKILINNGVTIIPDVLANSGSAIVCQFERVQGLTNDYWELNIIRERQKKQILKAYQEVLATAEKMNITMRDAAWVIAVTKIGLAVKTRGWA